MSLCNVILQPATGFLMSDAGVWDWNGQLISLIQKVQVFPRAGAAVVVRGNGAVDGWVQQQEIMRGELVEGLPKWAARIKAENQQNEPRAPDRQDLEVTVLYWDGSRPRARQLDTAPGGAAYRDGYAAVLDGEGQRVPGEFYDLPEMCLMPTLSWDAALPDLRLRNDERRFDVRASATRIVSKQRETLTEFGGRSIPTVAGWVDMAIVTRSGVTLERVVTW